MGFAVQRVDYAALVSAMAEAGLEGMGEVLNDQLTELPKPKWKSEPVYFWGALFNAARENDLVWLWLGTTPHIRHFASAQAQMHTTGRVVDAVELPEIGADGDEWIVDTPKPPKQWPSEPTEENFLAQAAALDKYLIDEGKKNPRNRCQTLKEFVATFYHSGSAQMNSRTMMFEGGYHAFACPEGTQWLRENYPPDSASATA